MNFLAKILPRKGSNNSFLSLDIGTDYVKVLAFETDEEGPKVVAASKQSLPWGAVRGGLIVDEIAVGESCKQALDELKSNLENFPSQVVVGLGGELVCNFTTVAKLNRKYPDAPISEKELQSIRRKIEEVALIEGARTLGNFAGGQEVDIELVDSEVVNTKIDDFVMENPVSFKGESVETTLFTSYALKSHLETIRRLLKTLKLKPLDFSSNLSCLNKTLGQKNLHSYNAVIIDVGGETTDVAVVFGGTIVGSRTLGLGGRFFSQIISLKLGIPFNEADLRKVSYSEKKLPLETSELVATALDDLLPIWLNGLELTLGDIEGIKAFPKEFQVVGGGAMLPEVAEFIRDFPWGKSLPINWPLRVDFCNISELPLRFNNIDPTFFNAATLGLNFSKKLW